MGSGPLTGETVVYILLLISPPGAHHVLRCIEPYMEMLGELHLVYVQRNIRTHIQRYSMRSSTPGLAIRATQGNFFVQICFSTRLPSFLKMLEVRNRTKK